MDEPDQTLSQAATVAWVLHGVIACVVIGGLEAAIVPVLGKIDGLPGWVPVLLVVAGALTGVTLLAVRPWLSMRTWRYAVRADDIDIRHGWLVSTRTLIPMTRVQHVDTEVGLIGQLLGLSTLRVHTAAGKHEIPYLSRPLAAGLRDDIARRAHVPDEI